MEKKDKNIYIIIFAIIIGLALIATIVTYVIGNKKIENKNEHEDKTAIDNYESNCSGLDNFELKKCLEKNIENGKNYTKDELLSYGFSEINISDIDLDSDITEKTKNLSLMEDSTSLELFEQLEGSKIANIVLDSNNVVLNYYNRNGNILKTQKIENIKRMQYFRIGGGQARYYIFLIDYNDKNYQMIFNTLNDVEKVYNNQFDDILFKELNSNYIYSEFYKLYEYATTDGAVYSYIGKTLNGDLRFIDNGDIYNENTYKIVNNKVSIMKNRDIYFDNKIQSFKMKLEYDDFALTDKVNYILSDNNYLYDTYLQLQYDKKVIAILHINSLVITIYEDEKNFLLDNIEIKK